MSFLTIVAKGMDITPVDEDTITADGTEQTVADVSEKGIYEAVIDLTNMAIGDVLVVRMYIKVLSGGAYVQNGLEVLEGAQTVPSIYALRRTVINGFKLTIQQTAGVNRDYDYCVTKQA